MSMSNAAVVLGCYSRLTVCTCVCARACARERVRVPAKLPFKAPLLAGVKGSSLSEVLTAACGEESYNLYVAVFGIIKRFNRISRTRRVPSVLSIRL